MLSIEKGKSIGYGGFGVSGTYEEDWFMVLKPEYRERFLNRLSQLKPGSHEWSALRSLLDFNWDVSVGPDLTLYPANLTDEEKQRKSRFGSAVATGCYPPSPPTFWDCMCDNRKDVNRGLAVLGLAGNALQFGLGAAWIYATGSWGAAFGGGFLMGRAMDGWRMNFCQLGSGEGQASAMQIGSARFAAGCGCDPATAASWANKAEFATAFLEFWLGLKANSSIFTSIANANAPLNPAHHGIDLGRLQPTATVAGHIPRRPYINSPHTIRNIIESGTPVPDRIYPGALRWDVPGSFRGSAGTFELVIDPATNRILHFLFTSGG
jgi:hypothetical protein